MDETYTRDWTCTFCGRFVSYGTPHNCEEMHQQNSPKQYYQFIEPYAIVLGRIATALEKLVEILTPRG